MAEKNGLSIFDDDDVEVGDEEPTQVIPRVPASDADSATVAMPVKPDEPSTDAATKTPDAGRPATAQASEAPAEPPTEPDRKPLDAPAHRAAPGISPAALTIPQLPVVRRGGYDRDAVDHYIRGLLSQRSELEGRATSAESDLTAAKSRLEKLTSQLAEHEAPSYAGLGGRASEMLRLAEEQSEAVLLEARQQAEQTIKQAERDAAAIRARADSEAEDMRGV